MNKVPKAILLIILSWVLLLVGCSPSSEPSVASAGKPAPDFQLQSLDGQTVSLSSFHGKPVLINFWTTWCSPCRVEMPYIQQIHEEWSGVGLILLAINIGESSSKVESFMQSYNLSLPVLLDTSGDVAQRYNITGIPTTFFIDKDGIIQERIIGAFLNKEAIEKHLRKIIP